MSTKIAPVDIIGQQIQMLNLVLDLEQNEDDSRFSARDGNTIHYVFDENVFEMFFRPRRMKAYTSTFDSSFWRKISRGKKRWSSFAAQSALIASEYLLSGELPGQDSGKIYMTEWHHNELMSRITELLREQQSAVDAAAISGKESEMEASLRNLIDGARRRISSPERGRHVYIDDPLLESDMATLAARGRDDEEGLNRFKVARIAAQSLADDDVFEPIEQISRVLDNNISSRLLNLTSRFTLADKDLDEISTWANFWHGRLKEELAAMPLMPGRKERPPGAVWSDANSLALVGWAANACPRDRERVVLVTGDTVLFNTYRRWFVDTHEERPGAAGPFMLRRIVQYAPILNMNKKFSDFAHPAGLIESTQQAMEVSLLPFNLSSMSSLALTDRGKLNRGRGHFALKKVTEASIDKDPSLQHFLKWLSPDWFAQQHQQMEHLSELWKRSERMAIGSMFKLISRRLNNRQKKLAEAIASRGEHAIGHLLTAGANKTMKKILDENGGLFIPAASNFVDEKLRSRIGEQGRFPLRAPIAVRIILRSGNDEHDLVDLVERWVDEGDLGAKRLLASSGRPAETEPELAFAVASVLALGLHLWSDADRYAGLAVRAAAIEARKTGQSEDPPYEMRYMHAVAQRFRVGEIGNPVTERTMAVLKSRYASAKSLLDACFIYHQRNYERPANLSHAHVLRLFRTRSERAALHLFFGASVGMADVSKWERGASERALGLGAMQDAAADLLACKTLMPIAEKSTKSDARRDRFFARLRKQFVSNLAAYRALSMLLYTTQGEAALPSVAEVVELIERHGLLEAELPFVVRAEIRALFVLAGRNTEEAREELRAMEHKIPKNWLAFDRDLFARILEKYSR